MTVEDPACRILHAPERFVATILELLLLKISHGRSERQTV